MEAVAESQDSWLAKKAVEVLPRILTHVARDPGTEFYGACDRDWWHYKIRDFPSIILQQAGYALFVASQLQVHRAKSEPLQNLAAATCRFWNQRACKHGAFEEYYPFEQGYPPAAFSTLAIAKMTHAGVVTVDEVLSGLRVAAKQLQNRFESEAVNQQIAGLAAMAVMRKCASDLINGDKFHAILDKVLSLQTSEGWFPEYHGPDLGYLAVSIDCLWDVYDFTHDTRVLDAIGKAVQFINWFVLGPIGGAGMHNSRNTDYITPFGLVRYAIECNDADTATAVWRLFNNSTSSFHPFSAIDDRYWCHYIGHSVMRAALILENKDLPAPAISNSRQADCFPKSGHKLIKTSAGEAALVSTKKGGIVSAAWNEIARTCDFGWIVQDKGKVLVTHWWSADWSAAVESKKSVTVEGALVAHKDHISGPWKHMALRLLSFVLGRKLIATLKKLVIFKRPQSRVTLKRKVEWQGIDLLIRDEISGIGTTSKISRAPRSSKRHVASADSFHPEDFFLCENVERTETSQTSGSIFTCETRYRPR